tara:strand:+ start:2616 stop:3680 length:1065 start_codon:yes stop_codon:yes gene_type:complete
MTNNEIIVTVGPSSCNKETLQNLRSAGADIFRINLSHSNEEDLKKYLNVFDEANIVPSIDTQGPQLRVKEFSLPKEIKINDEFFLFFGQKKEDLKRNYIRLNHPEVSNQIEIGDILKIDFNGLAIKITDKLYDQKFICNVIATGSVLINRAVDISGKSVKLNVLTNFDKFAIDYSFKRGCRNFFCSFVSSSEDIVNIRKLIPVGTKLISKVETAKSLVNIEEIFQNSDAVLIDRGDLSREISIALVPIAVEKVLSISKKYEKDIYIATNILDSMMTSKVPSRAEISDIYNLLSMGAKGLVLAAEVAIGRHPVESVALVKYIMKLYEQHSNGLLGIGKFKKPNQSLVGKELYQWL